MKEHYLTLEEDERKRKNNKKTMLYHSKCSRLPPDYVCNSLAQSWNNVHPSPFNPKRHHFSLWVICFKGCHWFTGSTSLWP